MANENGCRVSELRSCLSTVSELICSAPQLIKHSCIFDHCLAHGTGHGFKSKGNWFLLSWCYFYRKLFSPEALKEKHSPQFIPSWRHLQSSSEVGAEWSPLLKKKKKKEYHKKNPSEESERIIESQGWKGPIRSSRSTILPSPLLPTKLLNPVAKPYLIAEKCH